MGGEGGGRREEGGRRNVAVSLLAVHVLHINRVFAAFFLLDLLPNDFLLTPPPTPRHP